MKGHDRSSGHMGYGEGLQMGWQTAVLSSRDDIFADLLYA